MTSPRTRREEHRALPEFGAYVHVPFCAHRCDYCAFATWTDRDHLVDRYLDAVEREIRTATERGLPEVTSVFVGGGTPTLVDPHRLASLLELLPRAAGAEVTVECNPESLTPAHVEVYRAAGVNRLSIGVQAMVPRVLDALGRRHDPDRVVVAVEVARAGGIDNLNLDVIYGASGESLDDWRATVDAVVALGPEHVSAYALTVEPGTPLADDPARYPDDDDQAAKYALVTDALAAAGYEWYEISNWAKPGRQCRHNLLYWSQGDYRGFGCAAHSHEAGRRWWNVRTPERYVELIERGAPAEAAGERLEPLDRRLEALQLSLRTAAGVPADALSVDDERILGDLVERVDDRLVLTRRGRLLANEVALRLR